MTKESEVKSIDGLIGKSTRISQWHLVVAILTLLVAVAALIVQSAGSITITIAFVVILLVVSAILVGLSLMGANGDSVKYAWYNRIVARERLRLSMGSSREPLKSAVRDLYISGLRTSYQFALVEGQKELADFLKKELAKEEPHEK